MIRLINRDATKTITFDEATFTIRQLNGAQKLTLTQHFRMSGGDYEAGVEALIPTLSKGILKIEGIPGTDKMTPRQILDSVDSAGLFIFLTMELLEYSELTEEEAKNSDSSSDSPSSTGSATAKGAGNASSKKKK